MPNKETESGSGGFSDSAILKTQSGIKVYLRPSLKKQFGEFVLPDSGKANSPDLGVLCSVFSSPCLRGESFLDWQCLQKKGKEYKIQ